ncbi:hypothetical protein CTAYLR_008586 [Chrysophaeum taylorii]|uniref:SKI-interacting protein SKIP SNW domain-containing protein n=1 Tax=Chrysophaeum taylorii TaxID=2483200 RepID=A0AAD7UGA9_9STRA|nr:hypothetical protein CTAYLR_008586 [Chrysophaeum taylorii]
MATARLLTLPAPTREYVWKEKAGPVQQKLQQEDVALPPPSYGERVGWKPKKLSDYGDGGAYPEVHIAQHPLGMGKKETTAVVPLEVDAQTGQVKYDAIVKQGANRDRKVYSSLDDIREKEGDSLALPSAEKEAETAARTQAALGAIIEGKINSAKPTHVPEACARRAATFVRYTPNPTAPGYTEAAKQRIVKMVEQQVDPMEPPKHKHSKIPRGPPSPPVPVLHSPPRKVTVADQQSWKIPPCVSNWKNARGYTIPLDKRLAADGRGLQEQTVNNNFATLAEALYIAERSARDEVRARAQIRQQNALQEKEAQEARLRELAAEARRERSAVAERAANTTTRRYEDDDSAEEAHQGRVEREEARIQRKRERERQMRLDNAKGDLKRSRLERERDRDVSEKIALGLLKGTAKLEGEAQFDKRLFNQSAGLDSGLGADDDYNVYSKPLLDREDANAIYRPRLTQDSKYGDPDDQYNKLKTTSKFAPPDQAFAGTEGAKARQRDGPVQFERNREPPAADEQDPFGLDQFLSDVKNKRP